MEGHHPACDDTLSCYISVHEALGKLCEDGTALGDVINGAVADPSTSDKPAVKPTKLSEWIHVMGALYENYTTYSAFAVGGQERYSDSDNRGGTVTMQLQVVKDGEVVKAWFLNKPLPVDELLPYCTAVAATVRSVVELPSDGFAALRGGAAAAKPGVTFRLECAVLAKDGSCIRVFNPPTFFRGLLRAVREKLMCANFTLVPYKLSVCSAGGAVKPHVDTSTFHSSRVVGTVVVSLPSKFKGGALGVCAPSSTAPTLVAVAGGLAAAAAIGGGGGAAAVAAGASSGAGAATKRRRDGTAKTAAGDAGVGSAAAEEEAAVCTFDWAPASAGTEAVQWAAYFGDCMHEVKPVTAGHRVTVTFAMVLTDGTPDDDTNTACRRKVWEERMDPSVVAPSPSVSALHRSRFVGHAATCPVPTFGILLTQQYTFTTIAPASLKGVDRVVYHSLIRAGLRVTLRPVVYSMYTTSPSHCDYHKGKKSYATNVVYAFDAAEVARLCAASTGGPKPTDTPFVLCSGAKQSRLRGDEPVGVCLHHRHASEDDMTSAEDHKLFFAVALMVSKCR